MALSLEKDSTPSLLEENDCHTKKVKVMEKQDDKTIAQGVDPGIKDMEVNMEDVAASLGLTKGVSFKDKLVGMEQKSSAQKKPFATDIGFRIRTLLLVKKMTCQ